MLFSTKVVKSSILSKEPSSKKNYLELKPLPDNLEYVFLEEPSFLPVIISSQLSEENKNKLISVHAGYILGHDRRIRRSIHGKFSVFGSSFDHYLNNLDKMLQHCKYAHLVHNWEKCHLMVKEEIVLGHKVSEAGLEVDKAKIEVISKLPPPLISKIIVHIDHSALRHLFKKQDAKPRLIRWILLLQEFYIEIKDIKGTENVAADHLSQIENDETSDDSEVDDNFPGEALMEINIKDEPWFADFANYLVSDIILKGMTYQQRNRFFSDLKHYFWEEPYLFKVCFDGMIRRCVSGPETRTILDQCHHGPTGGHYGPNTTKRVVDCRLFTLVTTIIKEAHTQVRLCEACQKTGNISKCDEMPLNNI
ncbi:hypothetical protein Tco_0349415 [Tanacetum coccineum]